MRSTAGNDDIMDELSQNDAYVQSLVNGIPDLLFVLSQDGIFLDYRGEQSKTFVSPDYFIGRHYREILPGIAAPVFLDTDFG